MGSGICCAARDDNKNKNDDVLEGQEKTTGRVYQVKQELVHETNGTLATQNAIQTERSQALRTNREPGNPEENLFIDIDSEPPQGSDLTDRSKGKTPYSQKNPNQKILDHLQQNSQLKIPPERNKEPRFLDDTPKEQQTNETNQKYFKTSNNYQNSQNLEDGKPTDQLIQQISTKEDDKKAKNDNRDDNRKTQESIHLGKDPKTEIKSEIVHSTKPHNETQQFEPTSSKHEETEKRIIDLIPSQSKTEGIREELNEPTTLVQADKKEVNESEEVFKAAASNFEENLVKNEHVQENFEGEISNTTNSQVYERQAQKKSKGQEKEKKSGYLHHEKEDDDKPEQEQASHIFSQEADKKDNALHNPKEESKDDQSILKETPNDEKAPEKEQITLESIAHSNQQELTVEVNPVHGTAGNTEGKLKPPLNPHAQENLGTTTFNETKVESTVQRIEPKLDTDFQEGSDAKPESHHVTTDHHIHEDKSQDGVSTSSETKENIDVKPSQPGRTEVIVKSDLIQKEAANEEEEEKNLEKKEIYSYSKGDNDSQGTKSRKHDKKLQTMQPRSKPAAEYTQTNEKAEKNLLTESPSILNTKEIDAGNQFEMVQAGPKFSKKWIDEMNDTVPDTLDTSPKKEESNQLQIEERKSEPILHFDTNQSLTNVSTPRNSEDQTPLGSQSLPSFTPRSTQRKTTNSLKANDEDEERPSKKSRRFRKYPTLKK